MTSGSSLEFDSLIKIIDQINFKNKYNIICQIGKGKYTPLNCSFFRFSNSLTKHYLWADLIITHTGGNTLSEICKLNKKSISISNPLGYKGIYEIAKKFNSMGYLKYIEFREIENNSQNLVLLIDKILNNQIKFKKYSVKNQKIGQKIKEYLNISDKL